MHNMTPCINLQGGQEFGQMNKPSDLTAKRQLTQLELRTIDAPYWNGIALDVTKDSLIILPRAKICEKER